MIRVKQSNSLQNISIFSSCWRNLWRMSKTRHSRGGGWPWPSPGSGPPPARGPLPQETWGQGMPHQDRGWGWSVPAILPQGPCRVQVWSAPVPPPRASAPVHPVQEHRGPRHGPGHPRPQLPSPAHCDRPRPLSLAPGCDLAWLPDLGYQDWRRCWISGSV